MGKGQAQIIQAILTVVILLIIISALGDVLREINPSLVIPFVILAFALIFSGILRGRF